MYIFFSILLKSVITFFQSGYIHLKIKFKLFYFHIVDLALLINHNCIRGGGTKIGHDKLNYSKNAPIDATL